MPKNSLAWEKIKAWGRGVKYRSRDYFFSITNPAKQDRGSAYIDKNLIASEAGTIKPGFYNSLNEFFPGQYSFKPNISQPKILTAVDKSGNVQAFNRDIGSEYKQYLVTKSLVFDSDYVPDVPVYYNPELINYYVVRMQMYYSYLASHKVISPLFRAIEYISKEINHNTLGIFKREKEDKGESVLKKSPIPYDELRNNPRLSFFNNTDASGDFRDFLQLFLQHYLITGNVYIMGDKKFKTKQGFGTFVALPPQFVTAEMGLDFKTKYYRYRPGVSTGFVDARDGKNGNDVISLTGNNEIAGNKDVGLYTELIIPPEMIIHIKRTPNALLPIYGVGIVEANEPIFQQYLILNRQLEHWMKNSAHPCGFIGQDDAAIKQPLFVGTKEQVKQALNDLESTITGKFNRGRIAMLPPGLKWYDAKPSSPTEIIDTMDYVARSILQLFNLPATLWSKTGAELPRYNNMHELTQTCRETTIKECLDALKVVCNKILEFQGLSEEYYWDYVGESSYTPEMLQSLVKDGMITRNMALKLMGLPPMTGPGNENADKLMVMQTITPLEYAGIARKESEETTDLANDPSIVDKLPAKVEPGADKPKPQGTDKTSITKKANVTYQPRVKSWRDTNAGGWISAPNGTVWKALDAKRNVKKIREDMHRLKKATLKKHGKGITERLVKHLSDTAHDTMHEFTKCKAQYEALADKFPGVKKARHSDDMGVNVRKFTYQIYDADSDADGLNDILQDGYSAVGADAMGNIAGTLTIALSSDGGKQISKYVNVDVADRAARMTKTSRDSIEDALKDSLESGDSWGGAANKIYNELSGDLENYVDPETGAITGTIDDSARLYDRAETISRTELGRAYDRATMKMMKDADVAKSYMVIGCEDSETDCNATDILPEELDTLEFHPNHGGSIVVQEFSNDFGQDDSDEGGEE
jgi:hypothetical protein